MQKMIALWRPVLCVLIVLSTLLSGCERPSDSDVDHASTSDRAMPATEDSAIDLREMDNPGEPVLENDFENYIERGDLEAITTHGTLRLLAPRGFEDDSLPRDGLPGDAWRALAEKFARNRGLEPQWVFVDSFADLIPALVDGRGDIIAINFSRTPERASLVAFTRPLEYVQEVLVTSREKGQKESKKASEEQSVDAADVVQVALRPGSAFAGTINDLSDTGVEYVPQYLEEAISHDDLLAAVAAGTYPATVIDSNLAEVLLPAYPELQARALLEDRRAIAWAVRTEAPELERALNEYFTEEHLVATQRQQRPKRDWAQIKDSRTLRVLTRNHPASYFMWRGELMGFDYDLLQRFAKDNGLRLSMVVPGPDVDLAEALNAGMGDVIAASLTVTEARKAQGLTFTRPYMQVTEQLIAAVPDPGVDIDTVPVAQRISGQKVAVNPFTSYYTSLETLAAAQEAPLDIVPVEGATTEYLIDAVAKGEYEYTVADSHLVAIERTYRDDFAVLGDLSGERDIAWAVRNDQPELLGELNGFLNQYYRGLFFNVTYNKYFKEEKRTLKKQQERLRTTDQLSPFDPIVRKHAVPADRDWRMVVSQMYQESRFNPKARSFAGALGLMQVMPRTAGQMGISQLYEPENGIRAGISYLEWLEERFPKTLSFDQKIYFTLAAYNAGHGHVRDARNLARQMGKDPDLWFGNVEEAMLKLSQPEYYKKARFGYVRGTEPVQYVRQIRERYFGYLSVAQKNRIRNL
ncbi:MULTISPECIES: transporter substrate-binding domain-containing protein [Microbulbifer]|uniref:Transporter substrate-binding domain-containing protein n=1 Tax=Microbulbifer celer TaxID=435905 RepID=A0ABW3U951_9GAMM|nr:MULTISPECIES: transporter substrate-binding domain-containing protein [Microbulbifer]UFN56657.1 transporter substrate-binding domain-containing protein [Microbulbifer celer]